MQQLCTKVQLHCVTISQCTLCHYVATVNTVSPCSYIVQYSYVTMQLHCTLCHHVATVYTVSLCSYSVHCVTMQLQCTLCHYICSYSVYCVTMHVAIAVHTVTLCSQLASQLTILKCTHCHYTAGDTTMQLHGDSVHCCYMMTQCTLYSQLHSGTSVHCRYTVTQCALYVATYVTGSEKTGLKI